MKKIALLILVIIPLIFYGQTVEPPQSLTIEFEAKVVEAGRVLGYGKMQPDFSMHDKLNQILKNQEIIVQRLDSIDKKIREVEAFLWQSWKYDFEVVKKMIAPDYDSVYIMINQTPYIEENED
jgi:hypothetical protein